MGKRGKQNGGLGGGKPNRLEKWNLTCVCAEKFSNGPKEKTNKEKKKEKKKTTGPQKGRN